MSTVYAILFVLMFAGLVIDLIDPHSVIRWGEDKATRKNVLMYYGIGAIAALLIFGATSKSSNKQVAQTNPTQKVEQQATTQKTAPAADTAKQKADYQAFYDAVLAAGEIADKAANARQAAAQSGDLGATLNAMKEEKQAIITSKNQISLITPTSSFTDAQKKELESGKQGLIKALEQREMFLSYLVQYMQGDETANQKGQDALKQSETLMMQGMVHIVGIGNEVGALSK